MYNEQKWLLQAQVLEENYFIEIVTMNWTGTSDSVKLHLRDEQTNGRTDKETRLCPFERPFVRSFIRLLGGVWQFAVNKILMVT